MVQQINLLKEAFSTDEVNEQKINENVYINNI